MSRRLVLWRHGRTEWNAAGRFQGQTDIDLDDTGREQAGSAARHLAALRPDLIVSSDLRRARDTAAALQAVTGAPTSVDARLRETFAGRWQGLTAAEIAEKDTADYTIWREGDPRVHPGGGESRFQVAERMGPACADIAARLPEDGLAVLVTHGGAARVAVATLIGLPLDQYASIGGLSNCAWSVLAQREGRHGSGWVLVEHNAGTLPVPITLQEG